MNLHLEQPMADPINPTDDKGRKHGYCVYTLGESGRYEVTCLNGEFNGKSRVVNRKTNEVILRSNWEISIKEGEEHQYFYTE
jgi:hypothetical protein